MMQNSFKIFVDQLKHGHVERIEEEYSPEFLDVHEKELNFDHQVRVQGEAYTADGDLILHLDIKTEATLPCLICNEPVFVPIHVENFYHYEPLEEMKSAVFSMENVIREAILLETPSFAECLGGCPKRKDVDKYLRKPSNSSDEENLGYRPFENL